MVRAWKRSGFGRAEFAAIHGVSPGRLSWWRWRLDRDRRDATARSSVDGAPPIELVRVEVTEPRERATTARAAWELTTPSGHTLRVFDGDGEALRLAVDLLARGVKR